MALQSTEESPPVGWVMLTLSVIYPVCVIGFELFTGMCAESFFDPIPSFPLLLLVLFVPAVNLALWLKLRSRITVRDRYLLWSSAIGMTVAAYYTLIFLPMLPLAVIGIMFMGLGVLPFAPLVSFICSIKLYRKLKRTGEEGAQKSSYIWKGVLITLLVLIALDLPAGATYLGMNLAVSKDANEHSQGVKLLRAFGDEDLLLRLSYDANRRATGVLSFIALMSMETNSIPPLKARQVYYKVTGEPFNHRPLPYSGRAWSRLGAFSFDNDLGGAEVGGRVEGLELISSSLNGSVSSDDNVAYMEWVMEFQNDSQIQREARIQIALPPDAVVSRATLWVDGEEREAAYAGRAKARQAYQSVVRTRRDPLLVTTVGTDTIMAQAFPIQPNGGKIKFKIGITAPLSVDSLDQASLGMPAIINRNFSFAKQFRHSLWFESRRAMQANLDEVENKNIKLNLHRLSGLVSDVALSGTRKLLTVSRDSNVLHRVAPFDNDKAVVQKLVGYKSNFDGALLIVVDGSGAVKRHIDAIISSLEHIPQGKKVGLIFASDESTSVTIDYWSTDQKQLVIEQLRKHSFVGGQDNAPALVTAFRELEAFNDAELLWIHSPQPVLFEGSNALLVQALDRLTQLPQLSLYSLKPGLNKLYAIPYIELNARTLIHTGNEINDLSRYLDKLYSNERQYRLERSLIDRPNVKESGSQHISRLWVRDAVFELIKNKENDEAISLAAENRLVTPVSGAVVLESQQQYEQNNLDPVEKNSVPTIPEPRQWIVFFITLVFLLWMLRQKKLNSIRPV